MISEDIGKRMNGTDIIKKYPYKWGGLEDVVCAIHGKILFGKIYALMRKRILRKCCLCMKMESYIV